MDQDQIHPDCVIPILKKLHWLLTSNLYGIFPIFMCRSNIILILGCVSRRKESGVRRDQKQFINNSLERNETHILDVQTEPVNS